MTDHHPGLVRAPVRDRFRTDAATLGAYTSDASIFRRVPRAVFEPRTVEDIRQALAVAREEGWAVTVRGGGTSVAGNAVGEGLVIDTSRHFDRVLDIDPSTSTARVQPGVLCDDLRAAAAPHGLTFGPDPSTHDRCTIGGMIGNNACGSHSLLWGTTADNVVELTVMRADGSLVTLGRGSTDDPALDSALRALRDENLALLRTELGRFPRQVSGYGLHYLTHEAGFDVAKAFAGTEGTCGIIIEALVRLVPRPPAVALAVLAFASVFDAAAAAPSTRRAGTATAEGMGGDLVAALVASRGDTAVSSLLPRSSGPDRAGGWLFCETTGHDLDEASTRAADLIDALTGDPLCSLLDSIVVVEPTEMRRLWQIREAAAGLATRLPDGREAWPSWEDSAVPPDKLAAYLRDLYGLLDKHQFEGIPYGHFGEGCVHLRISFELGTADGIGRFRAFMSDAADTVARHGGSLSGEHGDGRARAELLPAMYSPALIAAFGRFKQLFDPTQMFNPGVLVDPDALDAGLRPAPGQRRHEFLPIHALPRDRGSIVNAVNRCVGVGACRSDTGAMCPSFQVTHDEVHSTRGRARVLSEMFRGDTFPAGTDSHEVKDALDLCLSCRACASECPVNVDMATYKSEFLHQYHRHTRRPRAHYSMGWLPWTASWLHRIPGAGQLAATAMRRKTLAALAMRAAGVDHTRSMIDIAPRSFQSRFAAPRGTLPSDRTVVLWPDSFSNHFDPDVLDATATVLDALGYKVVVPQGFVCCGLTWHSTGQLDRARAVLAATVDRLDPYLDGITPILVLEPSCASMLIDEAPDLLSDNASIRLLSGQVTSLGEFVDNHRATTTHWPFNALDIKALSQVHCHERARNGHTATTSVLAELGVAEATIDTGCCGLAGNWGFEPGHEQMSRDLGERELFPRVRALEPDCTVLADGFSCRTQIREGTGVRGLHLAQLLRRALFMHNTPPSRQPLPDNPELP